MKELSIIVLRIAGYTLYSCSGGNGSSENEQANDPTENSETSATTESKQRVSNNVYFTEYNNAPMTNRRRWRPEYSRSLRKNNAQ